MIFPTAQIARAVMEGRKTQARRLVRDPERKTGKTRNGSRYEYTSRPWRPEIGNREVVQIKGDTALGFITITAFRQDTLAALLEPTPQALKDVRAEGHKTRAEFADTWMRHHDPDWPPMEEELCAVCEGHACVTADNKPAPDGHGFTCTAGCDPYGVVLVPTTPDEKAILERFRARHAHRAVWVIEFEPDRDVDRFLSAAARPRGDELGYTTSPTGQVADDLPAVDEVTQARLTRQAHERDLERKRRQGDELERQVADFCKQLGIPESDWRARARVRAEVEAGLRRRDRRAA